jgi:hypothetical protein
LVFESSANGPWINGWREYIATNTILTIVNDVSICLFVHRPNWEGGQYEGDDTTRFETLCLAMELGVDYVDVELKVRLSEQSNLFCVLNCPDKYELESMQVGTKSHLKHPMTVPCI